MAGLGRFFAATRASPASTAAQRSRIIRSDMPSISWTVCLPVVLAALLAVCWAVGARRRLLRLHAAALAAHDAWRTAPAQQAQAARIRLERAVADHDAAVAQRPVRWLARVLRRNPWGPL
jgi:hypothetical protein